MSDDEEMPPVGGMDGMDDDMSGEDEGGDMGYKPKPELPEGVQKEILTEAPPDNYKKPKNGDEVTVHYVGTLLSDGSEFDSSRGRNEPFKFTLGKGQVIKGWDLGVATMKKNELAKFTLAPEFAYGENGSPPTIPANSTLVFEVELISWQSKDDLFGDEGVIKTQIVEGKGWKSPKKGDEVLLSVKAEGIVDKTDAEYEVGSDGMGVVSKAVEKALSGMKRGEECTLTCSAEYAGGKDGGATVNVKLLEIYETKDVSFQKDKTVLKKQVKEAEGYDTPKDGAKVKLSVESATDGSSPLPGFTAKTLEFVSGNGEVCDALECAVQTMKKDEISVLTVSSPSLIAEPQLGLQNVKADKVVVRMTLEEYEKAKDTWDMSEEEKIAFGIARKDVGATMFKAGRLNMALGRYEKVGELFSYIDNMKDEANKTKAKELKQACELNKAACFLKLKDFSAAKKSCDAVLKDENSNVKAVYRRAQAELGLKNFAECIRECKRVVELDAKNKDARDLLKKAQAGQKEEDKKSKGLYANMCKALGKGPIPEPYKAKRPKEDYGDDEDDMEDENMDAADESLPGKDADMATAEETKAQPTDASA